MAQPTPDNLKRLANRIDSGTLGVHIHEAYALAHAGEALQHLTSQHTTGEIGLTVE
jgi:NADPH:quinone reductase-like Zn-dependent oxidoreductase